MGKKAKHGGTDIIKAKQKEGLMRGARCSTSVQGGGKGSKETEKKNPCSGGDFERKKL